MFYELWKQNLAIFYGFKGKLLDTAHQIIVITEMFFAWEQGCRLVFVMGFCWVCKYRVWKVFWIEVLLWSLVLLRVSYVRTTRNSGAPRMTGSFWCFCLKFSFFGKSIELKVCWRISRKSIQLPTPWRFYYDSSTWIFFQFMDDSRNDERRHDRAKFIAVTKKSKYD